MASPRTNGIVCRVITILTVVATVLITIFGCGDNRHVGTEEHYKLVLPDTMPDGYFRPPGAAHDTSSGGLSNQDKKLVEAMGLSPLSIVHGRYTNNANYLSIVGAWGAIDDPLQQVTRAFTVLAAEGSNTIFAGASHLIPPDRVGGTTMICRQAEFDTEQPDVLVPMCIWSDHSTFGIVFANDPKLTIDDGATLAAEIRAASRVKVS